MRYSQSTKCFYPENIHYPELPQDIVTVSDNDFDLVMAAEPGKTIEFVNGSLVVGPPPQPSLDECKQASISRLERQRNDAINQTVVSSALGQPHTYEAKAINRQFLNDLVILGVDSKFTCIDAAGIKARRPHTAAQLKQLATDIHSSVQQCFDRFEQLTDIVARAQTNCQIDQINW